MNNIDASKYLEPADFNIWWSELYGNWEMPGFEFIFKLKSSWNLEKKAIIIQS